MIFNINKLLDDKEIIKLLSYPINNNIDKNMIAISLIAYGYKLGIENYKKYGKHKISINAN